MEEQLYREVIMEHFKNPQNYGVIENADFDVSENNPLCGDEIRVTGRMEDGKLVEIKFQSRGCAISKAGVSIMTEKFLGSETEKIIKSKAEDFLEDLEINLSASRVKCALLGYSTLKKALL